MNINEIRRALTTEEIIERDPFSILASVSDVVNDSPNEEQGRELVLRALEKRQVFRGYEEILDALTRQVGLFPYLSEDHLSFKDYFAYQVHKPTADADFVFHRSQAEVYRRLISGDSVILSAPTSFGKSRLIDAVIATEKYANIAVVVPTIALIDETRQRLSAFSDRYKIVTQISQRPANRNLFVFTAERINGYEDLPKIDFFVIDEFYKIGALAKDESRTTALNQAFYRLHKGGGQFYMLGPNIKHIPKGLEDRFQCHFYSTNFSTVVSEVIPVQDAKDKVGRLVALAEDIEGQTLIYCRSPKRVNEVTSILVENCVVGHGTDFSAAAEWISEAYHPDWIFQKGLLAGVGMHHGRLPRSLSQFSVRQFNAGYLKFLVCTSTLIEGVNTSAKNVVILDDTIGTAKYDFFTFNNIRGRSGRMFRHFVGKVYLFNQPPQEELPFVDFPIFSQGPDTPESLLIQLDDADLTPSSAQRLAPVLDQEVLSLAVIRQNSGIDPTVQIDIAKRLEHLSRRQAEVYLWTGIPNWQELLAACESIWELSGGHSKSGVFSAAMLAFKIHQLKQNPDIKTRVYAELDPGQFSAKSPNEAVERVLEFDRNWAGFHFPTALMSLSRIQHEVFQRRFGVNGDYSFFAARVEALFQGQVAVTLEEYGLPIQVAVKLSSYIDLDQDLDSALEHIRTLNAEAVRLSEFEQSLLMHVQRHI